MRCEKCGTENLEGAVFCKKCGARLVVPVRARVPEKPAPPQKVEKPPSALGGFIALILLILIIAVPVWYFFLRAPSTSPATFTVSNITISPAEVRPSDIVNISATVTNTGDLEGTYTVTLKIDGLVEGSQDVTLTGEASETVSFTVTKKETKNYSVAIDGLTSSFTVKALSASLSDAIGDVGYEGEIISAPWIDIVGAELRVVGEDLATTIEVDGTIPKKYSTNLQYVQYVVKITSGGWGYVLEFSVSGGGQSAEFVDYRYNYVTPIKTWTQTGSTLKITVPLHKFSGSPLYWHVWTRWIDYEGGVSWRDDMPDNRLESVLAW